MGDPIKLATAQSLLQLAAALNIAYFAIREVNTPFYSAYQFVFAELEQVKAKLPIAAKNLVDSIDSIIGRRENFIRNHSPPRSNIDTLLFYSGCAMFAVSLILLFVFTVWNDNCINLILLFLITCITYSPVVVSVIFEINARRQFSTIKNDALSLRDQCTAWVLTNVTD